MSEAKIHLTITGMYAGTPLCGISRSLPGVEYYHAMYAPQSIIDSPDMCAICKRMWDESESD